jgi:hypothetical protein
LLTQIRQYVLKGSDFFFERLESCMHN